MEPASYTIRPMAAGDWPQVAEIYRQGIETSLATFAIQVPDYEDFDRGHLQQCRLVIGAGDTIAGWCALSPYSSRAVYRGVAELSLYVHRSHRGKGVGKRMLLALIDLSEASGLWTLQSSVLSDNEASLRLHAACGFRRVGHRERIGKDASGRWRDTVLMERRSPLFQE